MNDCINYVEGKKELFYLVKIIYKNPEAVVYKNMKARDYPKFSVDYPDIAFQKGLIVDRINALKQFEEVIQNVGL